MAPLREVFPSFFESDPDARASILDYYVEVDDKSDWYLADFNTADDPFDLTVLKTNFTELLEAFLRADIAAPLLMEHRDEFALAYVLSPVAVDVLFMICCGFVPMCPNGR